MQAFPCPLLGDKTPQATSAQPQPGTRSRPGSELKQGEASARLPMLWHHLPRSHHGSHRPTDRRTHRRRGSTPEARHRDAAPRKNPPRPSRLAALNSRGGKGDVGSRHHTAGDPTTRSRPLGTMPHLRLNRKKRGAGTWFLLSPLWSRYLWPAEIHGARRCFAFPKQKSESRGVCPQAPAPRSVGVADASGLRLAGLRRKTTASSFCSRTRDVHGRTRRVRRGSSCSRRDHRWQIPSSDSVTPPTSTPCAGRSAHHTAAVPSRTGPCTTAPLPFTLSSAQPSPAAAPQPPGNSLKNTVSAFYPFRPLFW